MKVRRPLAQRPRRKSTDRRLELEVCESRTLLAVFIVTNNADTGAGSLREALTSANSNSQVDLIQFNLQASELTIRPQTPLPDFTDAGTNLDATTQPGYTPGHPVVVISGQDLPVNTPGLVLSSSGNAIRGLVINQFAGAAGNGIEINSSGNRIVGNFIGTDVTGSVARPNGGHGVYVNNIGNNTIGGTTVQERNVISGNGADGILLFAGSASKNLIQGNYIGTNAAGNAKLGNGANGIIALTGTGNTIGGTAPGAGNLVSGNSTGILLQAAGVQSNLVQGNKIGTDVTGKLSLGNTFNGLTILGSGNNTIGGNGAASTNIISGNGRAGIQVQGSASNLNIIRNNYIGVDATGVGPLGNATEGVWNFGGVNTFIGSLTNAADGNIIANNGSLFNNDGVYVNGGSGVLVGSNSIYNNVGLGIHLSTGSNDSIGVPNITKVETAAGFMNVTGTFFGAANQEYDVQFFDNKSIKGNGTAEGRTLIPVSSTSAYLAITTNSSGIGTINVRIPVDSSVAVGDYLTTTLTRAAIGDTSEFSTPKQITAAPTTDLQVLINPASTPVLLGSTLRYLVDVTNAGPNTSSGSTLTVTLDPSLSLQSVSAPYTQNGQTITIAIGTLVPTGTTQFTIVTSPSRTGLVTSSASLAAVEIDPNSISNSNSTTDNVLPSADLGVTVSAPSTSPLGGELIYFVTGSNNGPSVADNVTLSFTLPTNSTLVRTELSVPGQVGSVVNGVVTATILSLPIGAGGNFTFKVTVQPNSLGLNKGTATIQSNLNDGTSSNNTASADVTVTPATDLSLQITSAPTPIQTNSPFTYTVKVHNAGPSAATGVQVTDILDASLINVSASLGTYDTATHTLTANLPTIAAGADYSFTITATPTISKQIQNQATVVNSVEQDTNAVNNTLSIFDPVSPVDLSITGVAAPEPSTIGQPLTFTFDVANAGPSPATNVVFTQILPISFTLVSTSPAGGVLVNTGQTNQLTVALGTLASGAHQTVTIVVTPTVAGPFTSTADVIGDETDTNSSNDDVTLTETVSPTDLAVVVSASPTQPLLGDDATFTVVVTNNGPAEATNVNLNDSLSGVFSIISATSTVGTPQTSPSGFTLSLPSLASGASAVVTVVVRSSSAGTVTSTATVVASGYDPIPGNNTSVKTATYVNTSGILQLEKSTYSVNENAGSVTLVVTRTKGNLGAVTINYSTFDGTAKAGVNYQGTSGSLSFGNGELSKTIIVPILDDGAIKDTLNFSVSLSSPGGGAVLGNQSSAVVSVVNTDIDQNPPKVKAILPLLTGKSINAFLLGFNQTVDAASAGLARNYSLFVSARDAGIKNSPDQEIQISSVVYNPTTFQVAIIPAISLPQNYFYKIVVNGSTNEGVKNVNGTLLAGTSVRGTDFVGYATAGTNVSYYDATGNLVNFKLTGGGSLTVNRDASGNASLVQLSGVVGRARQTLSGSVKRVGPAASGVTTINTLAGIGAFGDVYVKMTTPPFYVPNITGFKAQSIAGLLPKTPKVKAKAAVPAGPLKTTKI